MFSIPLQAAKVILNSLIYVVHFSINLNSVFQKKVHETYWHSSSIACQAKRADWLLRIFTFNDKNPLYLPTTLTLSVVSDQGVSNSISHKTFGISQTSRIVSLS